MAKPRVALVCGGSRGIGRAVARALASEGVRVTLLSRDPDDLAEAADDLEAATGARPDVIAGDVADADLPDDAVAQIVDHHGRLDILVNNASGPPFGGFRDLTDAQWWAAAQQNLLSVVRFTRAAVPGMVERGWGRVVSITTTQALEPDPGMVLSATLRAGVAAFTKAVARDLAATGVTVNNVCPSAVRTDRAVDLARVSAEQQGRDLEEVLADAVAGLPIRRLADPEECAAVVAFLASEAASYVTGISMVVDGASTKAIH